MTSKINVNDLKKVIIEVRDDLMWSNDPQAASLVAKIEAEMASLDGESTVIRWVQKHLPTSCSQKAVARFLRPYRDEEKSPKRGYCQITVKVRGLKVAEKVTEEFVKRCDGAHLKKKAEKARKRSAYMADQKNREVMENGSMATALFEAGLI